MKLSSDIYQTSSAFESVLLSRDVGVMSRDDVVSRDCKSHDCWTRESYMRGRVCLPWSLLRDGERLLMWMASLTPRSNHLLSLSNTLMLLRSNLCNSSFMCWPTGELGLLCSDSLVFRALSVSPIYDASQSLQSIWYTTPHLLSPGSLSLGWHNSDLSDVCGRVWVCDACFSKLSTDGFCDAL